MRLWYNCGTLPRGPGLLKRGLFPGFFTVVRIDAQRYGRVGVAHEVLNLFNIHARLEAVLLKRGISRENLFFQIGVSRADCADAEARYSDFAVGRDNERARRNSPVNNPCAVESAER